MSTTYAASTHHTRPDRPRRRPTSTSGGPRGLSIIEIVALMVIAALLVVGIASARPRTRLTDATGVVRVRAGQTLWSIALEHPVDGLTTAQVAEAIATHNGVSGGTIAIGQTLRVPSGPVPNEAVASR